MNTQFTFLWHVIRFSSSFLTVNKGKEDQSELNLVLIPSTSVLVSALQFALSFLSRIYAIRVRSLAKSKVTYGFKIQVGYLMIGVILRL